MKESDWKIFKKIKANALDLFRQNTLNDLKAVIEDSKQTHHERYGEIYDLVHTQNKIMASLFDGHSRSNAGLQLMLMRQHKIANQTLIEKMSDETQANTKPMVFN